jgi:hypothetical protein
MALSNKMALIRFKSSALDLRVHAILKNSQACLDCTHPPFRQITCAKMVNGVLRTCFHMKFARPLVAAYQMENCILYFHFLQGNAPLKVF